MTTTSMRAQHTAEPAEDALPLSAALRAGTREAHATAEHSPFVEHLMSGRLGIAAYADLVVQHHAIYTALEAGGDRLRAAGADGGLVLDQLARVPAIEADLVALLGTGWADRTRVLPATAAYVARLEEVGAELPHYAAHAYTRYLGDLSGGQAIARVLARSYALTAGASFYDFPQISRIKPFKDVYRELLDGLDLTPQQRASAVDEARLAFALNTALFADLAREHVR